MISLRLQFNDSLRTVMRINRLNMRDAALRAIAARREGNLCRQTKWLILAALFRDLNLKYQQEFNA